MTQPLRITVFGGTGFIGRRLVAALLRAGHRVRVAARRAVDGPGDTSRVDAGFEWVHADILNVDSIRGAVSDADLVINLVGAVSMPTEQAYFDLHERGARHVAQCTRDAGRSRLLHVSALGISADAPSAADRSKAAGEAAVRRTFPTAVILRPSLVYGEQDHFIARLGRFSRFSPLIPLIGARTRVQPVYVGDLVEGVVHLVQGSPGDGAVYQGVGPRVHSMRSVVQLFLDAVQRRRLVVGVPPRAAGPVAALLGRLPRVPVNRDFVALMQSDKVAEPGLPTLRELGIRTRAFESWLAESGQGTMSG